MSGVLLAIAINIATSYLPTDRRPAPLLIWSAVVVLTTAGVVAHLYSSHTRREIERPPPPAQLPSAPPAQLPSAPSDFVDRDAEIDQLRLALRRGESDPHSLAIPVVAIRGRAGVGKSALALHAAHQLKPEFPDGQLYVNLQGAQRETLAPEEILGRFLRALNVPDEKIPKDLEEQAAQYRTILADRQVLVVLDNAATSDQVLPALPGSSTCAVLITSRNPLYGVEGITRQTLEELPTADALDLLRQLVPERVDKEPNAAQQIVRHCGRLPLALRIAGARLNSRPAWPIAAFARRLEDERQRLTELDLGDLGVRASIELSYRELSPATARTFRLLSLLDGPDASAEVVAALIEEDPNTTRSILENLVDAYLLETPADGRYGFHDLLRAFARDRLAAEETDETKQAALRRALGWYLELANSGNRLLTRPGRPMDRRVPFADQNSARTWMDAEHPNIVAAIRQASELEWDNLTWQLGEAMFGFFNLRKLWRDWESTGELGLQAAQRAGDREAEGRMLHNLGYVLRDQRRFSDAIERLEKSLAIFRGLGDLAWQARVLGTIGTSYRMQGDLQQAFEHYDESIEIRRRIDDRQGEGQVLEARGTAYKQQGMLEKASEALTASRQIFRDIHDRFGEFRTTSLLGNVWLAGQDYERAVQYLEQSLKLAPGDLYVESRTLSDLGRARFEQRRFDEAIEYLERSRALSRRMGDRYAEAQTMKNLGLVLEQKRDHRGARAYWTGALAILAGTESAELQKIQGWLDGAGDPKSWSEWGT